MSTFEEIAAQVSAPGQPFELTTTEIRGVQIRTYVNAPANLGQLYAMSRAHGDKPFLVYEDERLSFVEASDRIAAVAHQLVHRYGIAKGDRVAIAMRNFPEWVISFAAITSIGAISVSMNSWWTADEMDYALGDSAPKLLIADDQRIATGAASCERLGIAILAVRSEQPLPAGADRWEDVVHVGDPLPVVDVQPDDDATILYTSGTTGFPKGAVSTHRAVISALLSFACRSAIETTRGGLKPADDPTAFILIVPLFHVTGCVSVMLGCFVSGAKLVIMYKWDASKALPIIERERITNFVGVPTQAWDLVHSPDFSRYDTSSLRSIGGGGAPAPPAQVELVAQKFPKGYPGIGYGMTETNAYGPQNTGPDYLAHPASAGRWVPALEIEIRDPDLSAVPRGQAGEIWFRGPNLIRGYWNKPEATADTIVDGWLRSGDLGMIDDDGFLTIVDRVKDMILRGGENVFCAEVEGVIYEHPAVHEAAVYGVPHERLGEEVAAAVLPKAGATVTPDELRAHVASRLASFKVPTHWLMVDEPLPRNAAGKFLKRELRDRTPTS